MWSDLACIVVCGLGWFGDSFKDVNVNSSAHWCSAKVLNISKWGVHHGDGNDEFHKLKKEREREHKSQWYNRICEKEKGLNELNVEFEQK